jgi:hypothetical protein
VELYRFGGAALRLDRVVAIRPEDDDVRVYFHGRSSVRFAGEDAQALREFVRGLADPPELAGRPVAGAGPVAVSHGRGVPDPDIDCPESAAIEQGR